MTADAKRSQAQLDRPLVTEVRSHVVFNGLGGFVDWGVNFPFNYNTPFTLSYWAWLTQVNANNASLIGKANTGTPYGWWAPCSPYGGFALYLYYSFTYHNGVTFFDPLGAPRLHQWAHYIVSWDGNATPGAGGIKGYLNGQPRPATIDKNTLGTRSINNTSANFTAGKRENDANTWAGKLDDLAVWDKQLSDAEALEVFQTRDLTTTSCAANLVGYWPVHGDTFPTLVDASGSAINGTMSGTMVAADLVQGDF